MPKKQIVTTDRRQHPPIIEVGLVHDHPTIEGRFFLEGWRFDTSDMVGRTPWDVDDLREVSAALGAGTVLVPAVTVA